MNRSRSAVTIAVAICGFATASAQAAQRTFVASTGNDANPCSVSAPCRSIAGALSITGAGGEVLVLDSAGYGTVNITQAVSIIAPPGVYAGISVAAGQGVTINATGATVALRGLTINSAGGTDGIVVQSAAKVHVDNCVVSGFSNDGIKITGPADVSIIDSATRENVNAGVEILGADVTIERLHTQGNLEGILISGNASVMIHNSVVSGNNDGVHVYLISGPVTAHTAVSESVIDRNSGYGIKADNAASGAFLDFTAVRNTITRNGYGIYVEAFNSGQGGATLAATDNDINLNTVVGLRAGDYASLIASRNTVTRNLVGMWVDFVGHLLTRGDNTVERNDTDLHLDAPLTSIGGK